MIPRLKPYIDGREFLSFLNPQRDAVKTFQTEFARLFEAKHAIAFPYGRSALWAFFQAFNIRDAEVILPAYTCVVVAHAAVLSQNRPRFVDISLYDYNMDIRQIEEAINERTRAVIATHLFGCPMDVDLLNQIVREAERRYGHKIWLIQDCAHSFGATWNDKLVCNEGDVALYGLNISKMITSVFGGMITTNDPMIADGLRKWRDAHFSAPVAFKTYARFLYLLFSYLAFLRPVYGVVDRIEKSTTLLDRFTKAYHLDNRIHFPEDYLDKMIPAEARVGLSQLNKYEEIIKRRRKAAELYCDILKDVPGISLPPMVSGATFSHYVIRVPDRLKTIKRFRRIGIQLGELIQYSIPDLPEYGAYTGGADFPNSKLCSESTINLPIYPQLSREDMTFIARQFAANYLN